MGVLDDILAGVREDLAQRQRTVAIEDLKQRCQHVDSALDPMPVFTGPGVSVHRVWRYHGTPSSSERS